MKKLDRYILKKFLGTFFLSLVLIICIVIIFDLAEKMDDFIEKEAPLRAIVFEYYLNFIPYFANHFLALFTFIAVILFTTKLSSDTEVIALLSSGVSYKRLLRPYLFAALLLSIFSFVLINWVIPSANKKRLQFEEKYIRNTYRNSDRNMHKQTAIDTYFYLQSYDNVLNVGKDFSWEIFEHGHLKSKLLADYITWDSTTGKWWMFNFVKREMLLEKDSLIRGDSSSLSINLLPEEFSRRENSVEAMNYRELNEFIRDEKFKGSASLTLWESEKLQRAAYPFSTIVLTIIGVSLSTRKKRGGMGVNIGLGLFLAFSYIMCMKVSVVMATHAHLMPLLAIWLPNILFAGIGFVLYKKASL